MAILQRLLSVTAPVLEPRDTYTVALPLRAAHLRFSSTCTRVHVKCQKTCRLGGANGQLNAVSVGFDGNLPHGRKRCTVKSIPKLPRLLARSG